MVEEFFHFGDGGGVGGVGGEVGELVRVGVVVVELGAGAAFGAPV